MKRNVKTYSEFLFENSKEFLQSQIENLKKKKIELEKEKRGKVVEYEDIDNQYLNLKTSIEEIEKENEDIYNNNRSSIDKIKNMSDDIPESEKKSQLENAGFKGTSQAKVEKYLSNQNKLKSQKEKFKEIDKKRSQLNIEIEQYKKQIEKVNSDINNYEDKLKSK